MLHFMLDISEFIQMDKVGFFLLIMFEDFMINVYINTKMANCTYFIFLVIEHILLLQLG